MYMEMEDPTSASGSNPRETSYNDERTLQTVKNVRGVFVHPPKWECVLD